jgi:hypothetical protein
VEALHSKLVEESQPGEAGQFAGAIPPRGRYRSPEQIFFEPAI